MALYLLLIYWHQQTNEDVIYGTNDDSSGEDVPEEKYVRNEAEKRLYEKYQLNTERLQKKAALDLAFEEDGFTGRQSRYGKQESMRFESNYEPPKQSRKVKKIHAKVEKGKWSKNKEKIFNEAKEVSKQLKNFGNLNSKHVKRKKPPGLNTSRSMINSS